MAVVVSSNLYRYSISNHSHFNNHHHHHHQFRFRIPSTISTLNHHQNRRVCACQSSSKSNNYEAEEEQRWLREEKRWLREEQRWLREEARWNSERHSLLRQINELSLQIQHLQSELDKFRKIRSDYDVDFDAAKEAALLQAKIRNQISEFSDNKSFSEFETTSSFDSSSENSAEIEKKEEKKVMIDEVVSSSLKVGAEGEEVRVLQEALMNLGFYSGEEDMEYSSFSTGTERAVKTWQASVGISEDGIMTAELLELLYASQKTKSSSPSTPKVNDDVAKNAANGAPTSAREVQQTVVKKESNEGRWDSANENRVFLLGENRWEDSSRLNKGNDKLISGSKTQSSAPKCLVCRGEGRLLCMECDGTGDLNVEEQQFLDWAEEGARCLYCDGLGYTICDVCSA